MEKGKKARGDTDFTGSPGPSIGIMGISKFSTPQILMNLVATPVSLSEVSKFHSKPQAKELKVPSLAITSLGDDILSWSVREHNTVASIFILFISLTVVYTVYLSTFCFV